MENIKVSIIMPVYNGEEYLKETLESVANQTFREFELIVVNDGSTDNSLSILEKYAGKHEQVKIINQKNSGVSLARNRALERAQGDYVCFLDSDDWMHPAFLQNMFSVIETQQADIVFCEFMPFYRLEQLSAVNVDKNFDIEDVKSTYGEKTFDFIMNLGYGTALWNKIFKRKLLEQYSISFSPESSFGEDMFFNWKIFLVAENVFYIKEKLYGYRQNPNGATVKYHPHLYESYKNEFVSLLKFSMDNGVYSEQLLQSVNDNLGRRIPSFLRMNLRSGSSLMAKYQFVSNLIVKQDIIEAAKTVMNSENLPRNRFEKDIYSGILSHNTLRVFIGGVYVEYRFRLARIIKSLRK